jgi:hypothetical protein
MLMANDNLRGRYRRDFTREPIGGSSPAQPSPAQPRADQSQPSVHNQTHSTPVETEDDLLPSLADIKSAHQQQRKVTKKKGGGFKKFTLLVLGLVFLGAIAGGVYLFTKDKKQVAQKVPTSVQAKASVPILYPDKLPSGYKVIQESFNISAGGIVAYYAEDSSGHRLNFTVQPRPANFDFESFYTKILTNATRFSTPLGEAAVGTANDHLLGSLATTKSWVIVSGNSKAVGADKIQAALSAIQAIK